MFILPAVSCSTTTELWGKSNNFPDKQLPTAFQIEFRSIQLQAKSWNLIINLYQNSFIRCITQNQLISSQINAYFDTFTINVLGDIMEMYTYHRKYVILVGTYIDLLEVVMAFNLVQ
ncbi:hypothetical protein D5086_009693 [Populus alba]|uniref:Uncharacterized protein n=1 Tax=Populus alba TaxID=43335 RepID=A0ACC4C786_POPAL